MAVVRVPPALRMRLGDDASEALVDMVHAAGSDWRNEVWQRAVERFERRISEENARTRVEILRWSFAMWITQMTAILVTAYMK